MPRIPPALLGQARRLDPLLQSLLPVCRDLPSSQNELRWLRDHAAEVASKQSLVDEKTILQQCVDRRAKGEPLQYILGSEFFGDLEIKCRPGVLIPRQETAASVSHLARILLSSWKTQKLPKSISVLDVCTGTGCIPLLFRHELFKQPSISSSVDHIVGVDISPEALQLADENKANQLQQFRGKPKSRAHAALHSLQFIHADLLARPKLDPLGILKKLDGVRSKGRKATYDILISNPPYISSSAFDETTEASVRQYEPKLALVPQLPSSEHTVQDGDTFYPLLWKLGIHVKSKIALFEVADMEQARRVAAMAQKRWKFVEIWRDDPGANSSETEYVDIECAHRPRVRVRGSGNGRSVLACTIEGDRWRGPA